MQRQKIEELFQIVNRMIHAYGIDETENKIDAFFRTHALCREITQDNLHLFQQFRNQIRANAKQLTELAHGILDFYVVQWRDDFGDSFYSQRFIAEDTQDARKRWRRHWNRKESDCVYFLIDTLDGLHVAQTRDAINSYEKDA